MNNRGSLLSRPLKQPSSFVNPQSVFHFHCEFEGCTRAFRFEKGYAIHISTAHGGRRKRKDSYKFDPTQKKKQISTTVKKEVKEEKRVTANESCVNKSNCRRGKATPCASSSEGFQEASYYSKPLPALRQRKLSYNKKKKGRVSMPIKRRKTAKNETKPSVDSAMPFESCFDEKGNETFEKDDLCPVAQLDLLPQLAGVGVGSLPIKQELSKGGFTAIIHHPIKEEFTVKQELLEEEVVFQQEHFNNSHVNNGEFPENPAVPTHDEQYRTQLFARNVNQLLENICLEPLSTEEKRFDCNSLKVEDCNDENVTRMFDEYNLVTETQNSESLPFSYDKFGDNTGEDTDYNCPTLNSILKGDDFPVQKLHERMYLLLSNDWVIITKNNAVNLIMFSDQDNVSVIKSVLWYNKIVKVFIYNKQLPADSFLWSLLQLKDPDNFIEVGTYLKKLCDLVQHATMCDGLCQNKYAWKTAVALKDADIQQECYEGFECLRAKRCTLITKKPGVCEACSSLSLWLGSGE